MLKKIFFPLYALSCSLAAYAAPIDDQPVVITVTNSQNDFGKSAPYFEIDSDQPCDKLWWQLSSSSDFLPEETIENICTSTECFCLSEDERAFIKNSTIYFFRAKGFKNDYWDEWSEVFTFVANENENQPSLTTRPNYHIYKSARLIEDPSTEYERNPFVDEETWNTLVPYFLPVNFPIKAELDKIFSKRRVLKSRKSMVKSGFTLISHSDDKVIVARHPYLKGYLIKAYSDEMGTPDWYKWKKRIDGVRAIEEKIIACGYQGIMKTPKKWIYPLPVNPPPIAGAPYRKNFILVVQEMDILKHKHNLKAYKKKMTPQILDAFYIVLTDLNLIDSIYPDNTPFCKDGRLAFIDTEHSMDTTRLVPITTVANFLSPEMYSYWEQLVVHGGPPR